MSALQRRLICGIVANIFVFHFFPDLIRGVRVAVYFVAGRDQLQDCGNHTTLKMSTSNISNLYSPPPPGAYMLRTPFDMPTNANRTVWAIAFEAKTSQFITATLSGGIMLIVTCVWSLVASAIIYAAPHITSHRQLTLLVTLGNSADPWSAFITFAGFTADSMGCLRMRPRPRNSVSIYQDSLFGLLLVTLTLATIVGSIVMGILGPLYFQIGNVAPVKTDVLYAPDTAKFNTNDPAAFRAFRGGPAMRALSKVQLFEDIVRDRVAIQRLKNGGLRYQYAITGVEIGFKHAFDLKMTATGECRPEHNWIRPTDSEDEDVYYLFDDPMNKFTVLLGGEHLNIIPNAAFATKEANLANEETRTGNVSYAVVAAVAHRSSTTKQENDPWYRTENFDSEGLGGEQLSWHIKRGLPALSCWHQDIWSCCGGQSVNGSRNMGKLPGIAVPEVLRDVVGTALLYPPVQIGSYAGMSALACIVSTEQPSDGILNTGDSSIYKDMERLLFASYISILNIFPDTTRFQPSKDLMRSTNLFVSEDTGLRPGAGDFVVSTPNVQTFNLTGLIATACVFVFLLILRVVSALKLSLYNKNIYQGYADRNLETLDPHQEVTFSPFNEDRWARFRAFSAIHLLRKTYEEGTAAPEVDWVCSEALPEPSKKPLVLVRCERGVDTCEFLHPQRPEEGSIESHRAPITDDDQDPEEVREIEDTSKNSVTSTLLDVASTHQPGFLYRFAHWARKKSRPRVRDGHKRIEWTCVCGHISV